MPTQDSSHDYISRESKHLTKLNLLSTYNNLKHFNHQLKLLNHQIISKHLFFHIIQYHIIFQRKYLWENYKRLPATYYHLKLALGHSLITEHVGFFVLSLNFSSYHHIQDFMLIDISRCFVFHPESKT